MAGWIEEQLNASEPNMDSKPWYLSKTVWVNVLTLVATVIGTVSGWDFIKSHPDVMAGLLMASSAVNVALRFLTSVPATLFPEKP